MATADPSPPASGWGGDRATLVLGLGNLILSDDAVGIVVAREAQRLVGGRDGVEFQEASIGGLELLDLVQGYRRVILVDAITTPGGTPGTVYRLGPDDLPISERLAAIHEVSLPTALDLGRRLGLPMPDEVVVIGIEVEDPWTLGETLTPSVATAVAPAAALLVEEIDRG